MSSARSARPPQGVYERERGNTQGLHIETGSHLNARSAAKTRTLHKWRGRLRTAEREQAAIQARESWIHRLMAILAVV